MSSLSRELVFLILQFLEEEKFKESVHRLEKESGFFFNMKYFEEKVQAGEWEEVEKYLSGFTKVDDNRYSMKIFFEIRKQKYLEALDRQEKVKALEILVTDLRVFSTFNDELYKEITQLLTLSNFRENEQLSKYGDTKTARAIMLVELKKLIEANPLFRDKLAFPTLRSSRLRTLINQSLNWQHQLCKNPRSNPDIKTLFTDHTCTPPNGPLAPTHVNLPVAAVAKPAVYTSLAADNPFPPPAAAAAAAANAGALAGWMANASASPSVQAAVVTASSIPVPQNQVSVVKHPRTPPAVPSMVDYQNPDLQLMKRLRSTPSVEEVTYPAPRQEASSLDDTKNSGFYHASRVHGHKHGFSSFTPHIVTRERLVSKPFKIWEMSTCSVQFQALMVNDTPISVSRVTWSPDGSFVGVAFSKHLLHLYTYPGSNDLVQRLEIDAHVGGVNDLAFAHPNKQLSIVTCGDDKLIKVWDSMTGQKLFNFEGHDAAVYSICPHHKENIQFIFSTAVNGKIKAWLYDNMGSRVDYDAPGHWCTTMLYSADGSRLFSCGTSKDGESFLVEWNESEGAIKRTYVGFRKKSAGVVSFDTTQNHFLAAGEDSQIKFWDMDNINLLTFTDAEGGLPSLPRVKFNKEGNLLAVTTADNGFKILANAVGIRSLRATETSTFDPLKTPILSAGIKASVSSAVGNGSPVSCNAESSPVRPSPILKGVDPLGRSVEKPRVTDDAIEKAKAWQLAEIVDSAQCRLVTLPESTEASSKVVRLLYTNAAIGILALGSNGVQKLWKWSRSEQNPSGKATTNVAPQLWLPNSGLLMANDITGVNLEEAIPCIALSKNDSYVMSATGGKVSLFNMLTFKVMMTCMSSPPASTFMAFHPKDNNILAIGMEDSTIHIYNVRVDEVKTKLKGHQKRITGLAFSANLGILVSSGADAHLCVWRIDTWEKRKSVAIQIPAGKAPTGDTRVQFHSDQIRMLVFHETQLAIYDASKMERIRQWIPQDVLPAPISCATYSCNSQSVYATFCDGNIGVFDADSLKLRCRIASSVYLSPEILKGNQAVYPLVVAAHPMEPNQFAIGLSDGTVKVMEPSESEGKWGASPPSDNGVSNGRTTSSSTTSNHTPDQLQR
ncbi:Protein TOPLESS [Hibiscus syriacus]|uniref:Protein TOPLESS n=1 Tax=Hibiscus syriacus TaxID=106335 RepID=A0A6A2YXG7_HIBSY|nr:Protein TOPLESS [Hibiscus syriacus]